MIIAFALMSIALSASVQTFTATQRAYRQAQDSEVVTEAFSFLLEDMTREARVSKGYTCAAPPCSGKHDVRLTRIQGINGQLVDEQVRYILVAVTDGTETYGQIQKQVGATSVPITPPSINITTFRVSAYTANSTFLFEPNRMIVQLSGEMRHPVGGIALPVSLQTTITSRSTTP